MTTVHRPVAGSQTIERYFELFLPTLIIQRLVDPPRRLLLLFQLIRSAIIRSVDRALAVGTLLLTAACLGTMLIARTDAWHSFASSLMG